MKMRFLSRLRELENRLGKAGLMMLLIWMPLACLAQKKRSYEGPGNWFVGLDVGTSLAMAENVTPEDFLKTEIPTTSIQIGRTLSPYFSLRLTAGYHSQMGHASKVSVKYDPETYSPYRFMLAVGTLDAMLNVTNLCRHYDVRDWFDLYIIIGGGTLYSFGFDKKVESWDPEIYPVDSKELLTWTGKVGLMGAWHVNRAWDLLTELDVHATENAYNGVVDRPDRQMDFFLSMRLGMTYFFGNGKGRHRYANPPVVHRYWKDL